MIILNPIVYCKQKKDLSFIDWCWNLEYAVDAPENAN
jgi:hypothetical protein